MGYVFHYTSQATAEKILTSAKLLAEPIYRSNDPFEDVALDFYDETLDSETIDVINADLKEQLHSIVRFLSFSNGRLPKNYEEEYEESPYLDGKARPGFFYPRMWGQYGNHHRGVCLVFDKRKLFTSVLRQLDGQYHVYGGNVEYADYLSGDYLAELHSVYQVDYDSIKELKTEGYVHEMLTRNYRSLYFRKDNDWRNEKEYRILLFNRYGNRNPEDVFVSIEGALQAIVLGMRFDDITQRFERHAWEYDAAFMNLVKEGGNLSVEQIRSV